MTMMSASKRTVTYGFTLVELLIVIVVIAILASVTAVAYNGIQTRAQNVSRQTDLDAWERSFAAYKTMKGTWPSSMQPGRYYCLGTGFPTTTGAARCRDFRDTSTSMYLESNNATLLSQLSEFSALPKIPKYPVGNQQVGPYVLTCDGTSYGCPAGSILLVGVFDSSNGADCPGGTQTQWDIKPIRWCQVQMN